MKKIFYILACTLFAGFAAGCSGSEENGTASKLTLNVDKTSITADGADKGKGLAAMARHFGLDISETMAFGDGGNDISIIRRAGTGVAMGNAGDNVKAAADYVTTSVDDDGVMNALVHFGVIDK